MLFHITMTHTSQDCPGYRQEEWPELMAAWEKKDEILKEAGIKELFLVDGAPEHVTYALIEADDVSSVLTYVQTTPYRQDFKVTAVQHEKDLVAWAKARMEQR